MQLIRFSYVANLVAVSSSRGSIAKRVEAEASWVSEGVNLGLGNNWPRVAGTDETDHLEDAGIVPDVADTGNAVIDDRPADHLSKDTRVGLVKRSGRSGLLPCSID